MAKLIRGQGSITKWLTSKIAVHNKKCFTKYINKDDNLSFLYNSVKNNNLIDIEVVSFSSAVDFSEQILSILTFIKYVGIPTSWIIYSDNSHKDEHISLLKSTFPFIHLNAKIFDISSSKEEIKDSLLGYKSYLYDYANNFPLGKKLFHYLNHKITLPTLFIDSDILFYQKAFCLHNLIKENTPGWFLPDAEWGNLDTRYLKNTFSRHYQVNSGLFLANKEFSNIMNGLTFLKYINGQYEYFSEQSILHIILTDNGFYSLDPRIFTLNSKDQFDFSYLYNNKDIASRHYTGPVRHKMWQRDWKWHLSL